MTATMAAYHPIRPDSSAVKAFPTLHPGALPALLPLVIVIGQSRNGIELLS